MTPQPPEQATPTVRTVYDAARLTKKQWRAALAAFDALVDAEQRYRQELRISNRPLIKHQQALFLLRGQMVLAAEPSPWEKK